MWLVAAGGVVGVLVGDKFGSTTTSMCGGLQRDKVL
jgi:hypothetical protein